MIEVLLLVAGRIRDRAEADSPEGAVVAARSLRYDAEGVGCATTKIETVFTVNGQVVATRQGAVL